MKKNLPKKFYRKMVKPVLDVEVVAVPLPQNRFPKISLTIPENISTTFRTIFSSRVFLFNFLCGFLLMAIGIVGYDIKTNMDTLGVAVQERQTLEQQIEQLKTMLINHKNYRDGLYQLAVLEHTLGRKQAAYEHTIAALELDPDFVEGKVLLEELTK